MTLLFITQKVDKEDALLGAYHVWLEKLAAKFEKIEVICLGRGIVELPANVSVHSLGKEFGASRLRYVFTFYFYIFTLRSDTVFVHMNQEYVLLAGWWWRFRRIPVYFWRNHPRGSWFTRLAYFFSTKVFYTSPYSYSARFAGTKAIQMPVGIDIEKFKAQSAKSKEENQKLKIIYIGRISPVKNVEVLIEAAKVLKARGVDFSLDLHGDPTDRQEDRLYFEKIKTLVTNCKLPITFFPSVPNREVARLYAEADLSVNMTEQGSMDKAIFEAMACGVPVIVSNKALEQDFPELFFPERDVAALAEKIVWFAGLGEGERRTLGAKCLEYVVKKHSLQKLVDMLSRVL